MKILVTGSNGFIGRYACSHLKNKGHSIIFHRRVGEENENTIICDFLTDLPKLSKLQNIDAVLHLAGIAHDIEGDIEKENFIKINADASLNLATRCAESGVKRFIFVSSVKASFSEDDKKGVSSAYALSKRKGEELLRNFSKLTNMEIYIIRPALVYGPGVKGNLRDLTHYINRKICPPLPEIGNKKSLIHIDDLICTIEKFLTFNRKFDTSEPFTICEDNSYSTRDIYQSLRVASGLQKTRFYIPYFVFKIIKILIPPLSSRIDKLFGDDYYRSNLPYEINFRATMSLKDFNQSCISIKD